MEIKETIIDKVFEVSMLFDFYGELLSGRQKIVMEYYYNDNYSFAEIADALNISRQAVYDALHKGENSLKNYERKLGLVKKLQQNRTDVKAAKSAIDFILDSDEFNSDIREKLIFIKTILNKLEE